MAVIRGHASVGVPRHTIGEAMGTCLRKLLGQASLSMADVDLYEINESRCSARAGNHCGAGIPGLNGSM